MAFSLVASVQPARNQIPLNTAGVYNLTYPTLSSMPNASTADAERQGEDALAAQARHVPDPVQGDCAGSPEAEVLHAEGDVMARSPLKRLRNGSSPPKPSSKPLPDSGGKLIHSVKP